MRPDPRSSGVEPPAQTPAAAVRGRRAGLWHRYLGLLLLLPLLGWGLTGLVFYFKPGYAAAYERLSLRFYPLELAGLPVLPDGDWLELRRLHTALGAHLLVRDAQGWQQLDPQTLRPRPPASAAQLRRLLDDALQHNPLRYGQVRVLREGLALTTTGVELSLDWDSLSLSQRGRDTRLLAALYDLHYLKLTGLSWLDRALALLAIAALLLLSLLGVYLFVLGRATARDKR